MSAPQSKLGIVTRRIYESAPSAPAVRRHEGTGEPVTLDASTSTCRCAGRASRAAATIGTEFIGTSISSDGDGVPQSEEGRIALAENPHIRFHNSQRRYVT